jgi:23S rRNA (cytidine1920-2'-O)/16S rRNA (cytidine1409-2'-O)-methyltransferase
LPPVAALLAPGGWIVALIKPQFEAGRLEVSRGGGVISDPLVHQRVLQEILSFVKELGTLAARGLILSPIAGRDGNHEYLLWLSNRSLSGHFTFDTDQPGLAEVRAVVNVAFPR